MKISKIVSQVKQKGRYSIFVDEKFEFGISELGLIDSGLRVGQELTKNDLEKYKEVAKVDKIYNLTLSLIARRPRSQWEIETYLRRKDIDSEVAQNIISKLRERKFIDDLDFARRWVESRRLLKSVSRRKLELELRTKRVSDDIAGQVLSEDETDDFEVLVKEIEKRRRQSRYQDDTKLMQYLARQGYRYDDIKRALAGDTG